MGVLVRVVSPRADAISVTAGADGYVLSADQNTGLAGRASEFQRLLRISTVTISVFGHTTNASDRYPHACSAMSIVAQNHP